MQISIEHLARLARLDLNDAEKDRFASQLSGILAYVEQLRELDTARVEPTAHVIPLENVMRQDDVRPSLPREEALGNAPDRTEQFYRVPKIIE